MDEVPQFSPPDGVVNGIEYSDEHDFTIGPTQIGEWLMIDVRVARRIAFGTKLYGVCQSLGERGLCGVIESTLVIDLLGATTEDRQFLLDNNNWLPAVKRGKYHT